MTPGCRRFYSVGDVLELLPM